MSGDWADPGPWTAQPTGEDDRARLLRQMGALNDLGRPAEALRRARAYLAHDPHDLAVLTAASRCALALDDSAQAGELARQAVALAPGCSTPLALLAQAQRRSGDLYGAHLSALDALRLDPKDSLALFEAGTISAIRAERTIWLRRRSLIAGGRQAADTLERLEPEWADAPALHALLSAVNGDWARHDREVARALARDPESTLAHNIALMGQELRGGPGVLSALLERLRAQPDNSYARSTLRAQFGYEVWRAGFARHWWLRPLHVALYHVAFLVLAMPVYLVWRTWRVWHYREAYRAAFLPAERRRLAWRYGLLWAGSLGLALLAVLGRLWPRTFTDGTALYGPFWLLVGAALLSVTLPAAFTGRGGLFGTDPEAPRAARPAPRPWTVGRALWPLVAGLLTLGGVLTFLTGLWAALTSSESPTAETGAGLGILAVVAALPALLLARAVHWARFGPGVPMRMSLLDAALSLMTLLFMLAFVGDVWRAVAG